MCVYSLNSDLNNVVRNGTANELALALRATRHRTLGLLDAWASAMPTLHVPFKATLNPPLWELGHLAWFQEWWIARNPQRERGAACNPDMVRTASRLLNADALFNSSKVEHSTRWHLPLPSLDGTLRYLEEVLQDTLTLLARAAPTDAGLYFWRLVLAHEAMHNEASVFMAQELDIFLPVELAGSAKPSLAEDGERAVSAQDWLLGWHGPGFAFDNELGAHPVHAPGFSIDNRAVSWARYLPFLAATGHPPPPHLRRHQGEWQYQRFGLWHPLDLQAAAVHLSWHDAQAWCAWAGRRLPSEAEWECAMLTQPDLRWGEVWEWTESPFVAYPGFAPHPYIDYSQPWFGSRRVLRGASSATSALMAHPRYRNFFTPERQDILSGFRSVV